MEHRFDSDEELYFFYYLEELKDAGFISRWEYNPAPFPLTDGLDHYYRDSKGRLKSQCLFRKSVYTPDFKLYWNYSAENVLFRLMDSEQKLNLPFIAQWSYTGDDNDMVSFVEVKGSFDRNNMTRLFINNRKFIWKLHGWYINLAELPDFFRDTFTPASYLLTKTGKIRKLNYPPKKLEEYIADATK